MTIQTSLSPRLEAHIAAFQMMRQMAHGALRGDLKPEQTVYCTAPSRSHILWLAGHVATTLDGIALDFTGKRTLPEDYCSRFGMGSSPSANAGDYPSLAELTSAIDKVTDAIIDGLKQIPDSKLDEQLPESSPLSKVFPTKDALLHALIFHTGYHMGQVSLLRRAQGLPTGFGF